MARDSWIRVGPGEQFSIHKDVPQAPSRDQICDFISRVRGSMLSVAWSVEQQLSAIIESFIVGAPSTTAGHAMLREELIDDLPFGKKARLAKSVAASQAGFDAAAFGLKLDGVVRNRNALAHGLASLVPLTDHPEGYCTGFAALLEHKASNWMLTPELATAWLAEAHECLEMSDQLMGLVVGVVPDANADAAAAIGR